MRSTDGDAVYLHAAPEPTVEEPRCPDQSDRRELARGLYEAFAAGDRDAVERRLAAELTFSSPVDVGTGPRRLLRALLAGRRPRAGRSISCA